MKNCSVLASISAAAGGRYTPQIGGLPISDDGDP